MKTILVRIYLRSLFVLFSLPVIAQVKSRNLEELPSWSLIRCAIQYKDSVNLNESEVDSLFIRWNTFQQLRQQNEGRAFAERKVEHQLATSILTQECVNKLLIIKSRSQALKNASQRLQELKGYKMVADSDQESVLNELIGYELKIVLSQEWARIDRSQTNLFRICDVKDGMPVILEELDKRRKEDVEMRKKWRF